MCKKYFVIASEAKQSQGLGLLRFARNDIVINFLTHLLNLRKTIN